MTCKYCGRKVNVLYLKFYTVDCCIECHKEGKNLIVTSVLPAERLDN